MRRISAHIGVTNFMVINKDGLPLYCSSELSKSKESQIKHIYELVIAARRMIRDVDPTDDLMFLRTGTGQSELLISPDKDFTVVVVQNVNPSKNSSNESL
ncbi:dynein light chain roadblock-type 2-like [Physella acuta]|uniref:dynein light chain roadblock-type 2-like n=1 Tax=Physella acuta TaxID=109671 RepID=UPI0027DB19AD|nr:dynein light chain roadblock-type 2-like [Physella acuta]